MNAASSSAAVPTTATSALAERERQEGGPQAGERAGEVLLHPMGIRMISLNASSARLRTATVSWAVTEASVAATV